MKVKLTARDLNEIYYALEYKLTSPAVVDCPSWIQHLKLILKKIGPDGDKAIENGIEISKGRRC